MPSFLRKIPFICILGILIFISSYPITDKIQIMASAEETGEVYFDELMGEFSTSYATSGHGRRTNVELAAKALDGVRVLPGEQFSFNKTVGVRSAEKVFPTHRTSSPYPVRIECKAGNGNLTAKLYGFPYYTDGLSVKFVSNLIKVTPCTEYQIEPDYSGALNPGESERIVRATIPKRESELIKITYYMGKEVERKRFRHDVYPAVKGIKIKADQPLPDISIF